MNIHLGLSDLILSGGFEMNVIALFFFLDSGVQ